MGYKKRKTSKKKKRKTIKKVATSQSHIISEEEAKGKKICELILPLSKEYKEGVFNFCCKEALNILLNYQLASRSDIDDALMVLKIIAKRYLLPFAQTHYCGRLLAFGFSCKIVADEIRKPILELAETIVRNCQLKKLLYDQTMLSPMYETMLKACDEDMGDTSLTLAKILYYLGNFDKMSIYIPGESNEIENQRKAFVKSGGFLLLLHCKDAAKSQDLRDFINSKIFMDADIKFYQLQIVELYKLRQIADASIMKIKKYISFKEFSKQEMKASINIGDPTPSVTLFKPITEKINMTEIIDTISEHVKTKCIIKKHVLLKTKKPHILRKHLECETIYGNNRLISQLSKHYNMLSIPRISHNLPSIEKDTMGSTLVITNQDIDKAHSNTLRQSQS